MKYTLSFLLLFIIAGSTYAQHTDDNSRMRQLKMYEDSLRSLGNQVINKPLDLERKNANYTFIKTLVSALKINDSYHYGFDSVKSITIIKSPDERFRLLTWHVTNDDGSFRFYGAIQMNTGGPLKLYPLEDYSPLLKNPEDSIVDNRKWYGCQYYKIVPVATGASPYYVLLGWKGNTIKSTKKAIDVLSFKSGQPVFGAPVFSGNGKTRNRVIFEYSAQASMVVRYVPEQHLLVFDHLSPSDPKFQNHHEMYGPDMTYSGYRLKEGHWFFEDNLDMQNVPSPQDALPYSDPKKQAALDAASAARKLNGN